MAVAGEGGTSITEMLSGHSPLQSRAGLGEANIDLGSLINKGMTGPCHNGGQIDTILYEWLDWQLREPLLQRLTEMLNRTCHF